MALFHSLVLVWPWPYQLMPPLMPLLRPQLPLGKVACMAVRPDCVVIGLLIALISDTMLRASVESWTAPSRAEAMVQDDVSATGKRAALRELDFEEEEDVEEAAAADEEDVADAFLVELVAEVEDASCVEEADADLEVAADAEAVVCAARLAPVADSATDAVGRSELREMAVGLCERHLPVLPLAVALFARRWFKARELWREERREP